MQYKSNDSHLHKGKRKERLNNRSADPFIVTKEDTKKFGSI